MSEQNLTVDDYGIESLMEVASAARPVRWGLRKHPERDGLTISCKNGYVIHPALGYVNDEADAAFMAMFDPPMVLSMLERLIELEGVSRA